MALSTHMRSAILLVLALSLLVQPALAVDHQRSAATAPSLSVLGMWWETLVSLFTPLEPHRNPKGMPATPEEGWTLDQNGTTTTQDCERGSIMDPNGCPHQ